MLTISSIFTLSLGTPTGILSSTPNTKATAPKFAINTSRVANRAELDDLIEAITQTKTTSEWLDVFEPAISTVAQPSYEMGTESAKLLLKRIKTPNRHFEQLVLQPQLMLR